MTKRFFSLLFLFLLLPASVFAGSIDLVQNTPAQQKLAVYIDAVNSNLIALGEQQINSIFEIYPSFADFGITDEPEAEIPESVEIHVTLYEETMNILTLRVSDLSRFPIIAAAFLNAASPDSIALKDAIIKPEIKAKKAMSTPDISFSDEITELNGTTIYVYYAYYPNQYHDNINWIEMTLVFPMKGYEACGISEAITSGSDPSYHGEDADSSYEGYDASDDFSHLDIAPVITPEPDSAAAEEMEKWR